VLHQFSAKLLKTTVDSSEEDYISLTEECRINFKVHVSAKFDGEGCYTLLVCMEETYIGEALCDFGANVNLISLAKARELGNLKMRSYNKSIGYDNGNVEMVIDILYDFPINIGGYDFIMDIITTDTGDRYGFPLILARGFFAQSGLIMDAEQGWAIIRILEDYQMFVVVCPEYEIDTSQTL